MRQGRREATAGAFGHPLFSQISRNKLLHKIQVRPVQDPQDVFAAGYLEPERPLGEEMKAGWCHPLMATMQATAITEAPDRGLGLLRKNKLAQGGAIAAFLACNKNGMAGRHELFQP